MDPATILAATRLVLMGVAIFERMAGRPVTEQELEDIARTAEVANRASLVHARSAVQASRERQQASAPPPTG